MPEPTFETISPLGFALLVAGAAKKFEMAYSGVTQAGAEFGNKSVGPEAWQSKDAEHVLLAFRGTDECEFALIQQDPDVDPSPVPDFMAKYGDNLLDAVGVTRVNWQKIIAGDQWSEDAQIGGGGISINPEGILSWSDGYLPTNVTITGASEVLPAITNGVDTPQDTAWITPAAGLENWPDGLEILSGASAVMAHSHIWKLRIRARLKCPDPLSGLYIILRGPGSAGYEVSQMFFTSGSNDWETINGQVANVYPHQIEDQWGNNGLAYQAVLINAFGPTPVEISEIDVQYETLD
jgi:hypothetical protein